MYRRINICCILIHMDEPDPYNVNVHFTVFAIRETQNDCLHMTLKYINWRKIKRKNTSCPQSLTQAILCRIVT